jgi:hypothetical protein
MASATLPAERTTNRSPRLRSNSNSGDYAAIRARQHHHAGMLPLNERFTQMGQIARLGLPCHKSLIARHQLRPSAQLRGRDRPSRHEIPEAILQQWLAVVLRKADPTTPEVNKQGWKISLKHLLSAFESVRNDFEGQQLMAMMNIAFTAPGHDRSWRPG